MSSCRATNAKELSTAQQMIIRYRDTETMRARIDPEEDRHV